MRVFIGIRPSRPGLIPAFTIKSCPAVLRRPRCLTGSKGPGRNRPARSTHEPLLLLPPLGLRRAARRVHLGLLLALKVRDDPGQLPLLCCAPGVVDLRAKAVADLRAP